MNVEDLDADWWAPEGDGVRSCWVAWYPDDLYDLGDEAAAAEVDVPFSLIEAHVL